MTEPSTAEAISVIGSMAVGFVAVDRSWTITRMNAAAEPILGRAAADLVGRDLWEEFPGARELEFGAVYERVMRDRRPAGFEAYYAGIGVWFELRVQPTADGIAVFFLDVTARHDAETAVTQAHDRLALLSRVSETLGNADDPDVAVGELARLVVPLLADWCVATIIDADGRYRDVGWAHRDPARDAEVAAYGSIQSASMTADSPVARSLRTGDPVIIEYLSDAGIVDALHDPDAIAIARSLEPHGVAVLPLTARGRTLGMMALVTTRERGPHRADELETALEVARRAGPVLDGARSAARARRMAASMQRSLLRIAPTPPGLVVASRYLPAYDDQQVGGDWFDVFTLADGSTMLTIGDVAGHDLTATAAMAQLRTMIRTTAWTSPTTPSGVLTATDDASFGLGPRAFATAIVADLAPFAPDGSAVFRWSNAGHPPPILLQPDGRVRLLDLGRANAPLGVRPGLRRTDEQVRLPAGATVVFYTDGLVESRERDVDTGIAELFEAVGNAAGAELDELLDVVLKQLTPPAEQHDDIAVLAVHIETASDGAD